MWLWDVDLEELRGPFTGVYLSSLCFVVCATDFGGSIKEQMSLDHLQGKYHRWINKEKFSLVAGSGSPSPTYLSEDWSPLNTFHICLPASSSVSHLPGKQLNAFSLQSNKMATLPVRKHCFVGNSEQRSEPHYWNLYFRLMAIVSGLSCSNQFYFKKPNCMYVHVHARIQSLFCNHSA